MMKPNTLMESLQAMTFTKEMAPEQVKKIASFAREVSFAEGKTIFTEGDLHDEVYLIQEGQVAVEISVPGKGRVMILTVGPGQMLAWSSFFPPQRKTATARALVATRSIAINAELLRKACEADHDLGYAVIRRVAEVIGERLKATRLQLLDMFAPGTEQ